MGRACKKLKLIQVPSPEMWSETIPAVRRSWRRSGVACFWATSLEEIMGSRGACRHLERRSSDNPLLARHAATYERLSAIGRMTMASPLPWIDEPEWLADLDKGHVSGQSRHGRI